MYKIKGIPHLIQVRNDFLDAGTFDDPRNIEIKVKLDEAIVKGDPELGERVVNQYLDYYFNALMVKNQIFRNEKEKPFHPGLYGDELAAVQQGCFRFGYVNLNKDWGTFSHLDTTKGVFGSGPQGTGKSYFAFMLVDQMLEIPPDERGFNIIIIQRVKREADYFALKYPWFRIWEWDDIRRNIWQVEHWETPKERRRSAIRIFAGENYMYSLSVPPLKYAVDKVCRANGVYEGSNNYPINTEIMKALQGYKKRYGIQKSFRVDDTLGKISNTLVNFVQEGENINCKVGMTTDDFLNSDICLNVIDVDEYTGRTIIMDILVSIQRRLQKIPGKTLVVIDEGRWLFDVQRDSMDIPSNRIVETWFTTARSSGFGRIILTQEPTSISSFVTSNSAFRISFPPIGGESYRAVAELHNLNEDQIAYIAKMAPFGEAIMTYPGGII